MAVKAAIEVPASYLTSVSVSILEDGHHVGMRDLERTCDVRKVDDDRGHCELEVCDRGHVGNEQSWGISPGWRS